MSQILELGKASPEAVREHLIKLDTAELHAQEIIQQGAIHAIAFLLQRGCTEETALEMMASMRTNARLVREEYEKRGVEPLFDNDQTSFN